MKFRKEPGAYLDRVDLRGESIIIERLGKPKAVLVPVETYNELKQIKREARERFWAKTQELRKAFAGIPPEEIEKEIAKAIVEVRSQRRTT